MIRLPFYLSIFLAMTICAGAAEPAARTKLAGTDGANWTEATSDAPWDLRDSSAAVEFQGKMWILGGIVGEADGQLVNDIWTSTNGTDWTKVTTVGTMWKARCSHKALVFDNKIWILGGVVQETNGSQPSANDVWSSPDGIHWTEVTAAAQWPARYNHAVAVFNGKMWVMGGWSALTSNDVWSSVDGATWTQVTPSGSIWTARHGAGAAVHDGKMWVMGGLARIGQAFGYVNDVWSTTDGQTWSQVTVNSPSWAARYTHSVLVSEGAMWLFGGQGTDYYNDVWKSSDGANWTQVTSAAAWSARHQQSGVVYDQKLWIFGGNMLDGLNVVHRLGDVWYAPVSTPKNAIATPNWEVYQ